MYKLVLSLMLAVPFLGAAPLSAQDKPEEGYTPPVLTTDPNFVPDRGDPGWRILTERCPGAVNDRETCKQCLSGVVGSGVDASTDVNEIIEGTLLLPRILEGREDRPSQEPKKVFMYHRFAVDENGVIYAPGELG